MKRHPVGCLLALACVLVIALLQSCSSSLVSIGNAGAGALGATTYPSADEAILGAEAAYAGLEAELQRMAESGIRNMGAYMRKMALNGYVLHVDLSPVRELVSLQRRCSNNLNQVAIQTNTYGGIYPEEIAALQRDYAALWGPLSDLLKKLSALVEL